MNLKRLICWLIGHQNEWDKALELELFNADGMRIALRSVMTCKHCDQMTVCTSWSDLEVFTDEKRWWS